MLTLLLLFLFFLIAGSAVEDNWVGVPYSKIDSPKARASFDRLMASKDWKVENDANHEYFALVDEPDPSGRGSDEHEVGVIAKVVKHKPKVETAAISKTTTQPAAEVKSQVVAKSIFCGTASAHILPPSYHLVEVVLCNEMLPNEYKEVVNVTQVLLLELAVYLHGMSSGGKVIRLAVKADGLHVIMGKTDYFLSHVFDTLDLMVLEFVYGVEKFEVKQVEHPPERHFKMLTLHFKQHAAAYAGGGGFPPPTNS